MFTLKIKWIRLDHPEGSPKDGPTEVVDESTMFFLADEIQVGSVIESLDEMKAWEPGSYFNYKIDNMSARNIQVVKDGKSTWYLASMAWLLGPDGKTIEKLT